jgi:hypothetical protein
MIKDVTNYGLLLQEIFGEGHSVNAIRHTIFQQRYGALVEPIKKMQEGAVKSGTSMSEIINEYIYAHLLS